MILIDTNGGNEKLPGWSHNLKAKPRGRGRDRPAARPRSRARVAEGAEREELWRACNEQYSGFDEYVEWLDRTPSVWVLEPVADGARRAAPIRGRRRRRDDARTGGCRGRHGPAGHDLSEPLTRRRFLAGAAGLGAAAALGRAERSRGRGGDAAADRDRRRRARRAHLRLPPPPARHRLRRCTRRTRSGSAAAAGPRAGSPPARPPSTAASSSTPPTTASAPSPPSSASPSTTSKRPRASGPASTRASSSTARCAASPTSTATSTCSAPAPRADARRIGSFRWDRRDPRRPRARRDDRRRVARPPPSPTAPTGCCAWRPNSSWPRSTASTSAGSARSRCWSQFGPFGVESDERFHVHGGNDQLAWGLADRLPPGTLQLDRPLTACAAAAPPTPSPSPGPRPRRAPTSSSSASPSPRCAGSTSTAPGLGARKRRCIEELGMGTNAKLLLQFRRHLSHYDRWNGEFYDEQVDTWCSSTDEPGRPGLLTVYSGGSYGAAQRGPTPHGPAPHGRVRAALAGSRARVPGLGRRLRRRRLARPLGLGPLDPRLLRRLRTRPVHPLLGLRRPPRRPPPLRRRAHRARAPRASSRAPSAAASAAPPKRRR